MKISRVIDWVLAVGLIAVCSWNAHDAAYHYHDALGVFVNGMIVGIVVSVSVIKMRPGR